MKNVSFEIKGSGNVFVFNEKTRIKNVRISVKGHNHVLYISSDCHIHGGSFWFEDSNCIIYIGEKTTIESAHFAVAEPNRKIIIGKDCMLSHDVEFRTSDSHSILDLNGNRINCAKDIIVYDHVWIGARATVLKGVTISKNVIIGNGSIVTRSVLEENCVSTGVPNCIIKRHVKWIRERIYK